MAKRRNTSPEVALIRALQDKVVRLSAKCKALQGANEELVAALAGPLVVPYENARKMDADLLAAAGILS